MFYLRWEGTRQDGGHLSDCLHTRQHARVSTFPSQGLAQHLGLLQQNTVNWVASKQKERKKEKISSHFRRPRSPKTRNKQIQRLERAGSWFNNWPSLSMSSHDRRNTGALMESFSLSF